MKKINILLLVLLLASCKNPDARRPVSQSTNSYVKESIEYNKKIVAHEEALIQKIIKEDTVNNYLTSNNGFWYYYNKKVIAPTPKPVTGDQVTFSYNLLHLNGTPIYSTAEIGTKTYIIDKQNLITGLRQGLKLMQEGETVTFLFPSYKAFGYYGDQDRIGVNVPIKSTVTLKSIQSHSEKTIDSIKTQP